ncbi:YqaJ viral recombinase family protein [Marinobacter sp. OP 3.4]|uniref:YqaJ viral recombinase family protein n=1 Tax=Marinobacter sp. OP 3.4 TaxID=3076501 RepID=UPI002E22274A
MKLQQGKIVNLGQGSPEWDALRAKRFTASEAPAMAGKSKYQSRSDLLKQKATGIAPEVTPHQQRIFDDGHRAEAAARPIVEKIIGDDLYPVVLDDEEGGFMASMDGLNMMGEIGFEHKWLSTDLAAQIDAGKLEDHYMIQLDQQFALSGADRIIFVGSDGTEDNLKYLWIERDESRFKALEAGWQQFAKDLSEYQAPEAEAPKPDGKAPDALPALSVQVQGMVTASNLKEFEASARATLAKINTDLKTDDDFADAEKTVKFCKDVESRLDGAKENVLGQMQTVDEVVKTIDRIKEETRQIRLKLDKAVKEQKEQRKLEILNAAREAWHKHMGDLEKALEKEADGLPVTLHCSNADFAGAMKGKRTISSLQGACDDTLAAAKIEANETAELIRGNIAQLNEHAGEHRFLFQDFGQICMKPADDFAAVVKMRIADYQAEQDAKAKRETEAAAQREAASKKQPANPLTDGPEISYREPDPAERPAPKVAAEDDHPTMPAPQEIVQVVANHYGVSFDQAMAWLASYEFRRAA